MRNETILVPVAPGQQIEPVMAPLLNYAERSRSKLILLSVVEKLDMAWRANYTPLTILERTIEQQRQQLATLSQEINKSYPSLIPSTDVVSGTPFIEIVKYAENISCDLIGIDARRAHKDSSCQYGSTTRHLMRKSAIPVWSLQPQPQHRVRRVVAAVDVASSEPETQRLNKHILQRASQIAQVMDAELILCHAWRLEAEGYLRNWARWNDTEIAKAAQSERQQRLQRLESLITQSGIPSDKVRVEQLEGNTDTVVPELVEQEGVDQLVMGTLCRSGIAGFIIGNTAERLLDALHCSVVTLKPDGFHSPVIGRE
ncbi:universal stress protein [Ferrimonas aestuarii]|uniref:Universal stress protein n=1 Tax=Ferrimonas aestuarii TaxID=2569539 RepID=A0A4U1BVM1_9GAMM|nr:universal stress protein [Ferrimonas aestuarii]TKB58661.1 universal stress protein [Ferrimonas aestuarii]